MCGRTSVLPSSSPPCSMMSWSSPIKGPTMASSSMSSKMTSTSCAHQPKHCSFSSNCMEYRDTFNAYIALPAPASLTNVLDVHSSRGRNCSSLEHVQC